MIAALVAFVLIPSWSDPLVEDHPINEFVQLQDSSVSGAAFAAVAPRPALNALEVNRLELALNLLQKGSSEFYPELIRRVLHGNPLRCKILPDAVMISFAVPPKFERDGEELLISLLKEPAFNENWIAPALGELQHSQTSYWQQEVDPRPYQLSTAGRQQLLDVFHRVFRPETVKVGMISSTGFSTFPDQWTHALSDWPRDPGINLLEDPPPLEMPKTQSRVSTAEWIGPELKSSPDSVQFQLAPQLLALYALGTGKTCSLFRVSRERHGWTYDQSSLLWPNPDGWEPRLFLAMAPNSDNRARLAQLSGELKDDVGKWTDETRTEALGMAEANLLRGVPYGPLTFGGDPISDDLSQRIALDLYWSQKTGTHFSRQNLLALLATVDLNTLKAAALQILNGSKLHYLPAEK